VVTGNMGDEHRVKCGEAGVRAESESQHNCGTTAASQVCHRHRLPVIRSRGHMHVTRAATDNCGNVSMCLPLKESIKSSSPDALVGWPRTALLRDVTIAVYLGPSLTPRKGASS
jgi:hypothetical protein